MTSLRVFATSCPDDCLACFLHERLGTGGCDGTLDLVDQWAIDHRADVDAILSFVESEGGFCDCEALANALSGRRLGVDDLMLSCGT
jgi:hypothetical protein